MKIKDLIDELQEMDEDTLVLVPNGNDDWCSVGPLVKPDCATEIVVRSTYDADEFRHVLEGEDDEENHIKAVLIQ